MIGSGIVACQVLSIFFIRSYSDLQEVRHHRKMVALSLRLTACGCGEMPISLALPKFHSPRCQLTSLLSFLQ